MAGHIRKLQSYEASLFRWKRNIARLIITLTRLMNINIRFLAQDVESASTEADVLVIHKDVVTATLGNVIKPLLHHHATDSAGVAAATTTLNDDDSNTNHGSEDNRAVIRVTTTTPKEDDSTKMLNHYESFENEGSDVLPETVVVLQYVRAHLAEVMVGSGSGGALLAEVRSSRGACFFDSSHDSPRYHVLFGWFRRHHPQFPSSCLPSFLLS